MLFRNEVHVQQKMLPVGEHFVFQTGFNKDLLCKKGTVIRLGVSEKNKTEDPSIRRCPEWQMIDYLKKLQGTQFCPLFG